MFISIMVHIKFDRHILYIIGVSWMVSNVMIMIIVSSSSPLLRHDYILKSLPGVKSFRGSSYRVNS